ncbi:hypothetical protein HYX08_06695 [Candidatus Woesearchaeota archaeon]|nr:hypothetical protein [Candidatus Woesearchaeota archaeon]
MQKKSLADYVREFAQKGYSASTIRNFLLKYGYSGREIDDAIGSIFGTTIRHEIHLSHTTALVVIFIFISLLGVSSFFYFGASKAPSELLDLNLEPITTTAEPGSSITFIKELSNLGSSKRYDVIIKQEVIEPNTNRIITQKIETRAIETFGSTQTTMLIPKDTAPGNYILRVIVEYDGKKAVATLPVKIASFAKKETCFDGLKNQDEEKIDCGGACKECEKQSIECNDNNPCTDDLTENDVCINKPIFPCCGNSICEEQEKGSCSDCQKAEPPLLMSSETLDDIKELARVDPAKALQQCNGIEVPDLKDTCIGNIGEVQRSKEFCLKISNPRIKDLCYSTIAKETNENSICNDISTDSRRDSCYMTFVLDNKDYSVCDKISNKHLRQSCESLRQLNELNQQSQEQQS